MSGAHQRAVATNPESSVVMERTTYMDLNTTLHGNIGTSDMAPSSVNAGVTWRNATLKGGIDTTDASTGISWNVGPVDTTHATSASPNTGVTRSSSISMHGSMSPKSTPANTGVTWSTLSGSVTSPPSSQSKPKPYNSWPEAANNSNNIGWAANIRSGWGPPAPAPTPVTTAPHAHAHAHPNPNATTIPEARKEVATDPNASWGTTLALGNTTQSNWEAGGGGGVDWASQWNRSSWHGGGSQSRPQLQPSRGQGYQRVICKFYESGYCKKGASCNYMHP